jgi:hypothetical protein
MQCVKWAKQKVLLITLGVVPLFAKASGDECELPRGGWGVFSGPVFVWKKDFEQRGLFSPDSDRLGWVASSFESLSGLRFENVTPGMGLPIDIFRVEIVKIAADVNGVHESSVLFPDQDCGWVSMFPGQRTPLFKITDGFLGENDRFRVMVWASKP